MAMTRVLTRDSYQGTDISASIVIPESGADYLKCQLIVNDATRVNPLKSVSMTLEIQNPETSVWENAGSMSWVGSVDQGGPCYDKQGQQITCPPPEFGIGGASIHYPGRHARVSCECLLPVTFALDLGF